jgi:hypothetical protein
MICPELESSTFAKVAEMFDRYMGSQYFSIKSRVMGFRVCKFAGKETEWSPMVS